MTRCAFAVAAFLSLAHGVHAAPEATADGITATAATIAEADLALEPVQSIPALGGLHSWRAVDERSLIIWATPFDPYLVELAMPTHDLRFARAIGVKAPGSRIHARFDSIVVDGLSYPISQIYKLDREQARKPLSW